jgi:hypothetical protein
MAGMLMIFILALEVGWMLGHDIVTLPIVLLALPLMLLATLVRPALGLIMYSAYYFIVPILPKSGYSTETYMVGLNVQTIAMGAFLAAWFIRQIMTKQSWEPLNRYGKLLLIWTILMAIGGLRLVYSRYVTGVMTGEAMNSLYFARELLTIPILSLVAYQTKFTRRELTWLIGILTAIISAAFIANIWSIAEHDFKASIELRLLLRHTNAFTTAMTVSIFTIAMAMVTSMRSFRVKLIWSIVAAVAFVPLVYTLSRSNYLAVALSMIVLTFMNVGGRRRNKAIAIVILLLIGLMAWYLLPHFVEERIIYTFIDEAGHQRLDYSVAIRFKFLELFPFVVSKSPYTLFYGGGAMFSPSIVRAHLGRGFVLHNLWLTTIVEYGTPALVVLVMLMVEQFRTFIALASKGWSQFGRSFAVGLAVSLIAAQINYVTHVTAIVGSTTMFIWLFAAIIAGNREHSDLFVDDEVTEEIPVGDSTSPPINTGEIIPAGEHGPGTRIGTKVPQI